MSILTYPLGFIGGGKEFYNGVMENSLRFNAGDSAYLTRTPQIDGNRYTWTFSCWFKGDTTGYQIFIEQRSSSSDRSFIRFNNSRIIDFHDSDGTSGTTSFNLGSHELRDPSAWYHLVCTYDSYHPVALEKTRMYINGLRTGKAQANLTAAYAAHINKASEQQIGSHPGGGQYAKVMMTDVYFIGGYPLGPEAFGEWKNGVWIPTAYAGPPPLITDSSGKGTRVFPANTALQTRRISPEKSYIGESAIVLQDLAHGHLRFGPSEDLYFPGPFTWDFWVYSRSGTGTPASTSLGPDNWQKWHAQGATGSQFDATNGTQISQWWGSGTTHAWATAGTGSSPWSGNLSIPLADKWAHVAIVRDHRALKFFVNGELKIANTAGSASNTSFGVGGAKHQWALSTQESTTAYSFDGYMDELRMAKEALPPRFYFGTNYGDEDGGRLPQRATIADRFVDDERTTLLISGQSANNHARAVSIVDESGLHSDNVHFSNSTVSRYPTTDGVGRQWTVNGPQHTTKESFVGNTSSILLDGIEDLFSSSIPNMDGRAFQVDFWTKPGYIQDGWNEIVGFNNATGGSRKYINVYFAAANPYIETYNASSGTQKNFWSKSHIQPNKWVHISLTRDTTTENNFKMYMNGHLMPVSYTGGSFDGNLSSTYLEFGERESSNSFKYFDEIRYMVGWVDKPQIKWTHTQTAGAGNKAPYDVHGWRAHGHELTDDNATSLLAHGDGYSNNATGAYVVTAAHYGINTGNSPSDGVAYWLSGDAAANRDTIFAACWFQTTDSGLVYLSKLSDGVQNFAIEDNQLRHQNMGSYVNVPTNDGRWHLVCSEYSSTTDDDVMYFDGVKVYEGSNNPNISAYFSGTRAECFIGGYNGTAYELEGTIGQYAIWTHNADAVSEYMGENGVAKALYDLGPGGNWKAASGDYTSSYMGNIRHYWAFGNQNQLGTGNTGTGTAHADTTTTVYDRAAAGSTYQVRNLSGTGTITLGTPITDVFKDSSSANSIHHALVAGGGAHHTKAVTLKSDGTNGTSTTDEAGNTIYWCGSNSTATFANSSSFSGYGNTSIAVFGSNALTLADSADWNISGGDATIDFWTYLTNYADELQLIGQYDGTSTKQFIYVKTSGAIAVGISSVNEIASSGADGIPLRTWTHVTVTRSGTTTTIYRNGEAVQSATTAVWADHSTLLRIGYSGSNYAMDGYVDEVRWIKGAAYPSRFYLGNQAPISGSTLSAVKSIKFTRTDGGSPAVGDEYYRSGTAINAIRDTADFGTVFWWCKQFSMDGDAIIADMGDSPSSTNLRVGYGPDGWRVPGWFTQNTVDRSNFQYPSGKPDGSAGQSDINDDGEWVFGAFTVPKNNARSSGGGSLISFQGIGDKLFVSDDTYTTSTGTADHKFFGSQVGGTAVTLSIGGGYHYAGHSSWNFNGLIAQVGITGGTVSGMGSPGVLTHDQLKAIWELGPAGDARTITAVGDGSGTSPLQWYFNANLESGTRVTDGTAMYDLVTTDGTTDLTTVRGTPVANTSYIYASGAKRLSASQINEQSFLVANTSYFGNNHYANTKPHQITCENFGGFVDDEYTVLLLRGGHADGNTVFTDGGVGAGETITFPAHSYSYGKSRVAKELTVQNNAHHEITDEVGLHGSSIDFDGTNDAILTEAHEDFKFEADVPFCVECWHKKDDTSGVQTLIGLRDSGTVSHYFYFIAHSTVPYFMGGDGTPRFSVNGVTNIYGTSGWHHVAFQRWNDQAMMFVDGVCESVVTKDTDYDVAGVVNAEGGLRIGENLTYSEDLNGKIDELRITKGIPRYTLDGASISGRVPGGSVGYAGSTGTSIPTTPYLRPTPFVAADGGRGYFANTNVKLWIKSDSYPGDTSFIDHSGEVGNTPKLITNYGHTVANRPLIKTANSETDYALSGGQDGIYLDGTDMIIIPQHPDINVGSDDFTIEFWGNATWTQSNKGIICAANSTANEGILIRTDGGNGKIQCFMSNSSWGPGIATSDALVNGVWTHIAVQRDAETTQIFINGVSAISGTEGVGINVTDYDYYIGRSYDDSTSYVFTGYLDEIRISKMARYTAQGLIDSNYPNPSTEFGIQTEGSTYGRFDTQITANTTYQRYNYQHHDGIKATDFNGTAIKLDTGVTPRALVGNSADFTVCAWLNPQDVTGNEAFCGALESSTSERFYFRVEDSAWSYGYGAATTNSGTATNTNATQNLNNWTLITYTYDVSETSLSIYINGLLRETDTVAAQTITNTDNLMVGCLNNNGTAANFANMDMAAFGIWKTPLSAAAVKDLYLAGPTRNWTINGPLGDYTSHGTTVLSLYYAFGNNNDVATGSYTRDGTNTHQTGGTGDTDGTTAYDRSGNNRNGTFTGGAYQPGLNSSGIGLGTSLMIHSNTDIDGDTSIVDSSPSAYLINRAANGVAADPVYANTGTNRSVLGYNGVLFKANGLDFLKVWTQPLELRNDWTVSFWMKFKESSSGTTNSDKWFFSAGAGNGVDGGLAIRNDGSNYFQGFNDYGTQQTSQGSNLTGTGWYHIVFTCHDNAQSGGIKLYRNGSLLDTDDTSGNTPPTGGVAWGGIEGGWADLASNSGNLQFYLDQMIFIRGHGLTSTEVTNLYNSANGNTVIGLLGGLVVHEEFANTTVTQNTFTECLIHSNNATHHTPGSRYFYNDTANCVFKGTTGHAQAGYFNITAASGVWKFSGNTSQRSIGGTSTAAQPMSNPSVRLKRGYSYIFDFSESTSTGHKFYFANSTANASGYIYGADTSQVNQHITGLYGSHTAPTFANKDSLTWAAYDANDYGSYDGTSSGPGWKYVKFEVPIDCPKDLYYRCSTSGHQAMGNAVFVMEATEPEPVKVGNLPTLKTSTWNDRDYAGIGTNKSVIGPLNDNDETHLSIADSGDWTLGSTFNISFWVNFSDLSATMGICGQRVDANNLWFVEHEGGDKLYLLIISGGTQLLNTHIDFIPTKHRWYHINLSKESNAFHTYINGALDATGKTLSLGAYTASVPNYGAVLKVGAHEVASGHETMRGFLDEFMIHKGIAFNANTVIEYYQTGRAGNHNTANSSCVLHIKANSTYGDTTFTDSSPSAHTILNHKGVIHHIDDNRTANTALYFDGYSYIRYDNLGDGTDEFDIGTGDFTAECWAKPDDGTASGYLISNGGEGNSNVDGWNVAHISGTTYGFRPTYEEGGNHSWSPSSLGVGYTGPGYFDTGVWHHLAYVRRAGIFQFFVNGICLMNDASELTLNITGAQTIYIGRNHHDSDPYFKGFMDGVRITKGMPRYTSGIPVDAQSPARNYSDGRSSNVSSNTWATSSTRQYYGINTHTYLQTSKYSTNANTSLLLRGDDAETANDGVNMYGQGGFHLEFKEVGSGIKRDYNNFNTSVAGLGSDTSATQEFSDDRTVAMVYSRPNQGNTSLEFVNETTQTLCTWVNEEGTLGHRDAQSLFSVDSNTANVSISSGGTRTY